jgi:lactoylglutathione lyase
MKSHIDALAIDHINMNVKNLAESVDFYHQLFGFDVRKEQPEERSKIIGNDHIKLCLYELPDKVARGGISHFGFHVRNFGEIVARCEAMGVPMPYGVVEWDGSRSVYIKDPNGYEIELSEVAGGGL